MTALASLSPLLSSDWSTLRLARLSLVDIGGGSEAGVVFIRCVDTWHIYRFSSPHYHSFLRALSWHNATLLLTLISIVFMSPDPPPEMTLTQSSKNWDRLTLPGTRTAAGDMRRAVMWVRQCHADTAALTAAPRNILLGSMNSSRHSIVTYLSSSKSKAILFYSMIVCVSLYHGVCWHHLSSPGLAPDTRPVTRTAWAELFDLIFRKPTTQGPRQERGQHYNKTSFTKGGFIFCRRFNLYLNCRTQSFKDTKNKLEYHELTSATHLCESWVVLCSWVSLDPISVLQSPMSLILQKTHNSLLAGTLSFVKI